MTPWTDNSGKTWDLDKPFKITGATYDLNDYIFVGWFNPLTSDDGVRHDPRPVLAYPRKVYATTVLDPDNMTDWSQPDPEPEDLEPPLHSVVRDKVDDLWISTPRGWLCAGEANAPLTWPELNDAYGPLTLLAGES